MFIKIALFALLAVVVQFGFNTYLELEFNKHLFNHRPGPCRQVKGLDYGSEDLHMLPNGTTFISSGLWTKGFTSKYEEFYSKHSLKGRIYVFDMNTPSKQVTELSLTSTTEFDRNQFHPHGISAWENLKTGEVFLFVINHHTDGSERIEKFRVSLSMLSLQHVKSYSGDTAIKLMNDIAATGENSFYFTNTFSTTSTIARLVENFGRFPWSDVVYFNGRDYKVVADSLASPNGVQLTPDGKFVYVTTINNQEFRIYERQKDGSLLFQEAVPLHSAPDNIIVDPVTGDVYVGLHPVAHMIIGHIFNPENKAPSQVLQLKMKQGRVSKITELFVDDGSLISGSSVATVYKGRLLIGSVADKLVYCDVNVPL